MIHLILAVSLAAPPQSPPTTYTPPRPSYTPPSSPGSPQINPTPAPRYTPPPAPLPSGQNWKDKMWERYKQQQGGR